MLSLSITVAISYLVGAIPFGYLIGRWRGVDVLQHGSGNIGATNVGRLLGWPLGVLVFLLDFAKGALPAAAGLAIGAEDGVTLGVAAGLAAFVGHLFPVWLRFRGGKGVATGAGVVAVLLPLPTLAALGAWIAVVLAARYVSLASLTAAGVLCATHFALTDEPLGEQQLILTLFCLVASSLVFVKHRTNISRLLGGSENRLPDSNTMRLLGKTVHILALGLWFGMTVFFSFAVALTLFGSFETLAQSNDRPTWFPLPPEYKLEPGFQKDQGTRAAGHAISPLFGHYELWQGICGLLATVTALGWSKAEPGRRVHSIRAVVLLLALTTVVLSWPIVHTVSELRHARSEASDQLMLKLQKADAAAVADARVRYEAARELFVTWHLWSLLLNMLTIVLVTIAMALAAQLPPDRVAATRGAAERSG